MSKRKTEDVSCAVCGRAIRMLREDVAEFAPGERDCRQCHQWRWMYRWAQRSLARRVAKRQLKLLRAALFHATALRKAMGRVGGVVQ